jgi:hypothetical protein
MKAIPIFIACILISGTAIAEQNLTKAQAQKLTSVILESQTNNEYREVFKLDQISYQKQEDVWRFPSFGVGTMYIFEFRDDDGYYKIGTISNTSFGPALPKFHIAPRLRGKIRKLMADFLTENKKPNKS